MKSSAVEKILNAAIRKILRPLAKILLRNGLAYGSFSEIAKRVFVEVAFEDFNKPGKKQNVSRVSALTGLTRKEVTRIRDTKPHNDTETTRKYNRAVRVIGGWLNDPRYSDPMGAPRVLSINSTDPSFTSLVRAYSGDIPPQAMLDVLIAAGSVEKVATDMVSLVCPAYIPSNDQADKINILGNDVSELISTIDHNLRSNSHNLRFQRKVSNANINPESVDNFRLLSSKKAQLLLEEFDEWLYNNEVNTDISKTESRGKYISVGIYYYEDEGNEEPDT